MSEANHHQNYNHQNHQIYGRTTANHFSSSKSDYGGGGGTGGGGGRRNGGFRRPREEIEVQIMPQDDRWADNVTAITGNTSDHSVSIEADMDRVGKEGIGLPWTERGFAFKCQMYSGTVVAVFLCACALISPVIMVILPKIEAFEWKVTECGPECDGLLISFSFKLLILLIGTWAVFVRRPRATMPRIFYYRSVVLALVFVLILSYWLFYAVRVAERRLAEYELSYQSIVMFAASLLDALLFIHYLAVILIEIRHLQPQFYVKVVRSPDGQSRSYNLGQLSIQRAAVAVLEKYYQDFPIYNPHLESVVLSRADRKEEKRRHKNNVFSSGGSVIGSTLGSKGNNSHVFSPVVKYYDVDGVLATSTPNGLGGGILGPSVAGSMGFTGVNSLSQSHAPTSLQHNGGNHQLQQLGHNLHQGSNALGGGEHHHQAATAVTALQQAGRSGSSRRAAAAAAATSTSGHRGHHGSSGGAAHHRHHNDRFYEEHEYDRRVKKRRARLVTAAEEAFTHIQRVGETREQGNSAIPMDPQESAQAIFPSMARALQKYLRVTRQQPRHTMQSILHHLGTCLTFDLSAKAFLEKYLVSSPVLQNDTEAKALQSWGLVCDVLLSRAVESGTVFMLRQEDVSLLVTVSTLPHFNITEEVIDQKNNQFVLRLNSETSV